VRALFSGASAPDEVIASATWLGPDVEIETKDDSAGEAVRRVFRPVPVSDDDPALRTAGTAGPVQLPPGTLRWFLAAARIRGEAEGLKVVFEPSAEGAVGWDPAGTYRPFTGQVERMEQVLAGTRSEEQPGATRPEGERGPSAPGTEAARAAPAPSAAGHGESPPAP